MESNGQVHFDQSDHKFADISALIDAYAQSTVDGVMSVPLVLPSNSNHSMPSSTSAKSAKPSSVKQETETRFH